MNQLIHLKCVGKHGQVGLQSYKPGDLYFQLQGDAKQYITWASRFENCKPEVIYPSQEIPIYNNFDQKTG